jgi:HSP20 family protein
LVAGKTPGAAGARLAEQLNAAEERTMIGYFTDLDRNFELMNQLRRRLDRVFEEVDGERSWTTSDQFPRTNIYDTGKGFVLKAEVPGLTEKDVTLTLTQDVLTLAGERKVETPEGYSVHRRERLPMRFSRSFALPAKADPEKVNATIKDGILTVTVDKAPEVQPKQISIRAS